MAELPNGKLGIDYTGLLLERVAFLEKEIKAMKGGC